MTADQTFAIHDWQKMVDQGPGFMWLTNEEHRWVFFNKNWLAFTGRTLEQEQDFGWIASLHPDEAEERVADYLQFFQLRVPFEMEHQLKDFRGEYRWMHVTASPLLDAEKKCVGYLGVAIDITPKILIEKNLQQKEVELQKNNSLLESIIHGTTDAIFVKDREGRYLLCNEVAADVIGHPIKEIIGKDDRTFFDTKTAQALQRADRKVLRTGASDISEIEIHIDNHSAFFLTSRSPYFDAKGNAIGVIGIAKDVTQRKIVTEKLSELAAIVESSQDAIYSMDLKGNLLSWNTGAERMFGYIPQEVIGRSFLTLIPRNQKKDILQLRQALRSTRPLYRYETVFIHKNGKPLNVSLSISPITDSNGFLTGFSSTARNITQRKEIEKRKDEFISLASHELKTPLTSIKAFAQLLSKHFLEERYENAQLILKKMDTLIDRLTSQAEDLLDISRIQTGTIILRKEKFDLCQRIRTIIGELQQTTKIQLVYQCPVHKVFVVADPFRISQVLSNLISNAMKYAPKSNHITIRVHQTKKMVVVSVKDQGAGIKKSEQPKIFERFYRAERQRLSRSGTGLGLYIAQQIITAHHGRIWVTSHYGKGATFSFSLPLDSTLSSTPVKKKKAK